MFLATQRTSLRCNELNKPLRKTLRMLKRVLFKERERESFSFAHNVYPQVVRPTESPSNLAAFFSGYCCERRSLCELHCRYQRTPFVGCVCPCVQLQIVFCKASTDRCADHHLIALCRSSPGRPGHLYTSVHNER